MRWCKSHNNNSCISQYYQCPHHRTYPQSHIMKGYEFLSELIDQILLNLTPSICHRKFIYFYPHYNIFSSACFSLYTWFVSGYVEFNTGQQSYDWFIPQISRFRMILKLPLNWDNIIWPNKISYITIVTFSLLFTNMDIEGLIWMLILIIGIGCILFHDIIIKNLAI